MKKQSFLKSKGALSFYSSLLAICAGLIFGLIILFFVGISQGSIGDVLPAFWTIISTGLSSLKGFGNVLYFAVPLCFTGLAVAFAFKTGLFNIGASGQFLLGSFTAIYIGVHYAETFGSATWIIALLLAGVAGGLWALLPGILQAYRNVNVVVTTIMMNYIGLYLVLFLIKKTTYLQLKNAALPIPVEGRIPYFGINNLFPGSKVQGAVLIAIIAVIIIHIILNKTNLGFELKACGHNADAAKYAGINHHRSIVLSMVISGILAGLAGAVVYQSQTMPIFSVVETIPSYGFDGIAVALLGQSSAIGTALASLFFALLKVGGEGMQLYSFSKEIIDIISSSIVYFSALSILFRNVINYFINKKTKDTVKVVGGKN